MRSVGACVRAKRHVRLPIRIGFLGFGHGRPFSTFVWLVSSSEVLICINLKGEA